MNHKSETTPAVALRCGVCHRVLDRLVTVDSMDDDGAPRRMAASAWADLVSKKGPHTALHQGEAKPSIGRVTAAPVMQKSGHRERFHYLCHRRCGNGKTEHTLRADRLGAAVDKAQAGNRTDIVTGVDV